MFHEEIDQGKKRKGYAYTKQIPSGQAAGLLVPAAPDRVALTINFIPNSTGAFGLGTVPTGTDTVNIGSAIGFDLNLTIADHGTVVQMAWYCTTVSQAAGFIITETYEEPCACD